MKRTWNIIALFVICSFAIAIAFVLRNESAGRQISKPLEQGNIKVSVKRTLKYNTTSALREEIINHWATRKTEEWTDGEKVGIKGSRVVLGSLAAGKRIDEMNRYLLSQKSSGTAGSRWLLNPNGGYNFNTMACTPILYFFDDKPELLYPETREHLANNILTIQGSRFTRRVPYLPIQDSENHILMAESSRYLKNQWLKENGEKSPEFDNKNNGVEKALISFLEEIYAYGIYEFNSAPYLGYTYCSLLNINEFAENDEIKRLTEKILDRINWQYAFSSYKFKHFPPYRRKFGKKFKTNLDLDYHTVMLKIWASLYNDSLQINISRGHHHALWASLMSYRPPDEVLEWTLEKPYPYFVKIGYGYNSCPGIYSGHKDYLISAGGANQGKRSLIMPKPITLFLDDDASDLNETFHMYGPGEDFMKWNNTGVYQDFACTKGKVHIPEGKQVESTSDNWKVFSISDSIFLAVYSDTELGIMVPVPAGSAEKALSEILSNNSDEELLNTQFKHPNGNLIEYDLDSPKDIWVIKAVNKEPVNRQFHSWPFFEGNIDGTMPE